MREVMTSCGGVLVLALAACGTAGVDDSAGHTAGIASAGGADEGTSGDGTGSDSAANTGASPSGGDGASSGGGDDQVRFDIGDGGFCQGRNDGTYCDGGTSVQCVGGSTTDTETCAPGVCVDGDGCVACEDGDWTCKGPRVMACNTVGDPYWEEIEVCDPAAGMFCDVSVGGCSPLAPKGGTEPTGQYYQYSVLPLAADGFTTVCDVDAHEDRIYFVAFDAASQLTIGVYDVSLLDSDADGVLEPHQHPDDPEHQGPIEERVFTFVQSFPVSNPGSTAHTMELHATATNVSFAGRTQISTYDLATGTITQAAPAPPWIASQTYPYLAFLGYDELNGVWYSGNETARRVFQYDPETATWGYAFEYPALAGDHMDGMEVVVDQRTGTPYVYVSDMTSNFIGQYRHDPQQGWVQENLFTYSEANGEVVEGFGYGALNHFWVGSYTQNSVYEIGGGDLTEYLDPPG